MARKAVSKKPGSGKDAGAEARRMRRTPVRKTIPEAETAPTAASPASPLHLVKVGDREFPATPQKLGDRTLNVLPDMPDIRDRIYLPNLRRLRRAILPSIASTFTVRNQGDDLSCTGYALAHIVDLLRALDDANEPPPPVSARMLYEMAKRNDEWEGSAYQGSSVRGAIKGFFRNGVCLEKTAPDDHAARTDWTLTYEMAKEARQTRLGAYLRLQPDISDYHAALNEVGFIYVSAQTHEGWKSPADGKIATVGAPLGGHAFVIVGYDEEGFWILNSWGPDWGKRGLAHWLYEDWAANVMDAWVLQLGVRAPTAFGAVPKITPSSEAGLFGFGDPDRSDIIGHFINIDEGRFVQDGKYGSPNPSEMQETVNRLVMADANGGEGYEHLVVYAHGGLNSLVDEAKRIKAWVGKDIFGRNKLYNFHLMWGTDFFDELFQSVAETPAGRAGGMWDWIFEAGPGKEAGARVWRNMKRDAYVAFNKIPGYDGGVQGLHPLFEGLSKAKRRPKLHFVGHSAGSILIGHMLTALDAPDARFKFPNLTLGGIHLMAPACTTGFFNEHYRPYLQGEASMRLEDKVYLYNLSDELERADTVGLDSLPSPAYSHSLLYLVSRAYEDVAQTPLAGMQFYVDQLKQGGQLPARLDIAYAKSAATASTSHGGFDNDAATLTTIMSRILGKPAPKPPRADELQGY